MYKKNYYLQNLYYENGKLNDFKINRYYSKYDANFNYKKKGEFFTLITKMTNIK